MNVEEDLPDSDRSDSDFCPEKEDVADVSEASSAECATSEEEEADVKTKVVKDRKRVHTKQAKIRKRARTHKDTATAHGSNSESEDVDADDALSSCRRSTRQTEGTNVNGRQRATEEKTELKSDEEEKSRSDALWADFLSDVQPEKPAPKRSTTAAGASIEKSSNDGRRENSAKLEATSAPRPAQAEQKSKLLTVTEVLDFAGEEVRVEKVINADSIKENKASMASLAPLGSSGSQERVLPGGFKRSTALASGSSSSGGLGSLLNQIGKKKKISVLEKTKLDWTSFKKDEGIEEELQTFNKGKEGFLERQDFLQRTDLRQFEIEKNLRQSRRNH